MDMILKIYVFSIDNDKGKKERNLILPPAFGHCHFLLQLSLPKFCACFLSLEIKQSCCCQYSFQIKLFKVQAFQACCLLVIATRDLGLGGCHFASLLLVANRDPPGHGPHVDYQFPFPPFWL
jgi:hypothetical protein